MAGRWLTACALALVASGALAAEFEVSSTSVRADETLQVTLRLEGDFAQLDSVQLPVKNLTIEAGPSTASQYQWINGVGTRSKRFTWELRPGAAGVAVIGPLVLALPDGKRDVVPAVTVEVMAEDAAISSNDPARILEAYIAQGREGIAVVGELSRTDVVVGEQIILTWYLYATESVRDFRSASNPPMPNFWSEELPIRDHEAEQLLIAGRTVQRIAVRRVAIYPLAAGPQQIGSLVASVEVLKPFEDVIGGLGMFEARLAEVRRRSAPLPVNVRPLPAGIDAVGRYTISCGPPVVSEQGPVAFDVTVSGDGNLRGAGAPRFAQPPDAEVETEEKGLDVERSPSGARMKRSWRYLLYPGRDGVMRLPPVIFNAFDPAAGAASTLQCGGSSVEVRRSPKSATGGGSAGDIPRPRLSRRAAAVIVAALAALLGAVLLFVTAFRARKRRAVIATLIGETARETRHRLEQFVASRGLTIDDMDRGSGLSDDYRAVNALIELHLRERTLEPDVRRELARRLNRLLSRIG